MKNTQIQQQAKQILDKFAISLEQVESQKIPESYVDRQQSERKESPNPKPKDKDFKTRFLENAPQKNKDFILVERGSWK